VNRRVVMVASVSEGKQMRVRELAYRATGGLEVVLFRDEATDELTVSVSDERTGAYFEFAAAPDEALDVFYHPYAHAAFRGVPYDDALRASWAQAARAQVKAPLKPRAGFSRG
jgi:hypothetical protein